MTLRGSYREILRRVEEAERWVGVLAPASPGCAACAGWPDRPVSYGDDARLWKGWACRQAGHPGCASCHPRQGWPRGFVCPACGRQPLDVFVVRYVDWGRDADRARAHVPDRASLYEPLAGDDEAE